MAQPTFSDLETGMGRPRRTRRSEFLARLGQACPWGEWLGLVREARAEEDAARGVSPSMGRPRADDLVMLRMYMVQVCYNLSDVACEEQVWDSSELRSFVGVAPADVPDSTTLCKLRHLLERHGIGERMVRTAFDSAAEGGLAVSRGMIVDVTFVESPSSTKNARGERDPEAHQAMKGKNWHFGYKLAIGVDAASGVPHSVRMDPANAGDLGQVPGLVRGGDETAWADAGHAGVEGRPEVAGSEPLSGVAWHVARRRSKIATREQLDEEAAESSVRCAVEHVFHVVKDAFGLRRTRYRGLSKVSNQAFAAVAAAGCLVALRGGRPFGPPVALSSGRARVYSITWKSTL